MKYLVIDIGGTFIKYAVMDEECNIIKKGKCPTPKTDVDVLLKRLEEIYHSMDNEILGIAVSTAGVVDADAGMMINGGAMNYIRDLSLAGILEKRCGVAVTIENDAKCAALAELWRGSLKDCNNAIAFIIGTGLGGAVIVDRKIVRGAHFMGGEFSYMFLDAFHTDRRERMLGENGVPSLLKNAEKSLGREAGSLSGEELFELAQSGNDKALDTIRSFARTIAAVLANLQFIVDPERIAIGGGISAQPLLLQMIRDEIAGFSGLYPYAVPKPELVTCQFFNDSNLIGALYAHLEKRSA